MQRIILLGITALFSLLAQAQQRSLSIMKQAAADVLCCPSTRASGPTAEERMAVLEDLDELLVIGNDQDGFALVGRDASLPMVLGYSPTRFEGIKNGLAWYVSAVKMAATNSAASEQTSPASYGYAASVAPFLATHWDQGVPYNNQCPTTSDGSHYITGCVATAMSQVMRYYKYPDKGSGANTYGFTSPDEPGKGYNITVDFSNTTYQWDDMLPDYRNRQWTDGQAEAVSTLMYHSGVAVSMQYSKHFSSAFSREAREALVKYFGYDSNANLFAREFFSAHDWMRMVYGELNAKRPIYYTGTDVNTGGHAFVLCGYNEQGLVYVNWGWSGESDGYYDIALLNPSGTSRSYASYQDMVVGINPSKVTNHESHICMDNPFNASRLGKKLSFTGDKIINRGGVPFVGDIAIIMENPVHRYIIAQTTIAASAPVPTYERRDIGSLYGDYPVPTGAPDGEYTIYMASKDAQDTDWRLIRHWNGVADNYNGAILTLSNGSITIAPTMDAKVLTAVAPISRTDNIRVEVYDTTGRRVMSLESRVFSIGQLPAHGVYVVRQGARCYKVVR